MARRVSTHELPVSNGEKGMKLSASNHSWLPLLYTGRWRRFREKWAASNGRGFFPDVVPTGSSSWAMELARAPRGSFPLSHFPFRFFAYFNFFLFNIYNRLWSIKLGQPVPHETILWLRLAGQSSWLKPLWCGDDQLLYLCQIFQALFITRNRRIYFISSRC